MRLSTSVRVSVVAVAGLLALSGCDDPRRRPVDVTQTVRVPVTSPAKPRSLERPEYDCRIHAKDKICEVPWKDKVVLYCYSGKIPKVVRYREEC